MQHEQQHRGESPAGGGVVGGQSERPDAGTGGLNGSGELDLPRAPFADARLVLTSETVPSDQLWRAAIHAAREAAALAADLRRQLRSVTPPL